MNNLFDFMSMAGTYEQRKVKRYEGDNFFISTAQVTDSQQPYETAICHPEYNDGNHIIVETHDTRQEAEEGHEKWVATMTADDLPRNLRDISSAAAANLLDDVDGNDWRIYKRQIIIDQEAT